MFNQATLAGRVAADPEIRTTQSGKKVASFRIATSRPKSRDSKEYTEWHNVVAWGEGLSSLLGQYVRKGDLILVTGEIRNRSYEKDGDKRFITEIVMGPNDQVRFLAQNKTAEGHPPATDMDDEIPF